MKSPCNNCPWRKDAPLQYWDSQHFLDIWKNCQDDGLALMLCHKSQLNKNIQIPCAGAVIALGYESIGVRIAAMQGTLNTDDFKTGVPLYKSFSDMLQANGINPPDRNTLKKR